MRRGDRRLCRRLAAVTPWQVSLCKCRFVPAVPATPQLLLKHVLHYPTQGSGKTCSKRHVCPAGCHRSGEGAAEMSRASDSRANSFLFHGTTSLLEKAQFFPGVISHQELQ